MNAVPTTHSAPPLVTMIGGGQLARMTHQAAIALGQTLRVLAVKPDDPAAQVTPDVVIGAHTDLDALRRAAEGADALTFDHEHVPTELLEKLVAEGVNVAPPPEALVHAQDKLVMRRRLEAIGAPIPRYARGDRCRPTSTRSRPASADRSWSRRRAADTTAAACCLARDLDEARDFAGRNLADGVPVLVEERVSMRRELAALVARSPFGQGAAWPVVETVQRDGICVEVIAPAPGLMPRLASAAGQLALRLAGELGVVGVLAVELFETVDGALMVNELAMRPHNSGHWTMDGATHQSVRAASARGAGLSARRHRTDRAGDRDGQCAWRAQPSPRWAWTSGCTICSAGCPTPRCTCTARRSARAARSATSTSSALPAARPTTSSTSRSLRERAERAAHWLSHAQWTDGWDGHG